MVYDGKIYILAVTAVRTLTSMCHKIDNLAKYWHADKMLNIQYFLKWFSKSNFTSCIFLEYPYCISDSNVLPRHPGSTSIHIIGAFAWKLVSSLHVSQWADISPFGRYYMPYCCIISNTDYVWLIFGELTLGDWYMDRICSLYLSQRNRLIWMINPFVIDHMTMFAALMV